VEFSRERFEELNQNQLYQTMGIRIEEAGQGKARSILTPRPEVCWPFPGQPHGGVIFTLLDTTLAWAVWSELDQGQNCATVHLDIQYSAPARGDSFTCLGLVDQRTRAMRFVSGRVLDSKGRIVALGQATFRVIRSSVLDS
jgi:uncharacterized protein (TIGR00369 family)